MGTCYTFPCSDKPSKQEILERFTYVCDFPNQENLLCEINSIDIYSSYVKDLSNNMSLNYLLSFLSEILQSRKPIKDSLVSNKSEYFNETNLKSTSIYYLSSIPHASILQDILPYEHFVINLMKSTTRKLGC